MNRNTALSAAAALTLTVAGGVSALAMTMQPEATQGSTTPTIVTEYVDQLGNPVAAPAALAQAAPVAAQPANVIVVDENGTPLSTITPSQATTPTYGAADEDHNDHHHEHDDHHDDKEGDDHD